jgi:hypothetical protein
MLSPGSCLILGPLLLRNSCAVPSLPGALGRLLWVNRERPESGADAPGGGVTGHPCQGTVEQPQVPVREPA